MYVSLKPRFEPSDENVQKVLQAIASEIGSIARPKNVWIVQDMPKTRSGKIMRRGDRRGLKLRRCRRRDHAREIVEEIRDHVQSEKVPRGETPRELKPEELEEIKRFGAE